jgi:hypothetical protein
MVVDGDVGAARVFKGVSKDVQAVEGAFLVDAARKGEDGRRPPRRVYNDGAEGVANDFVDEIPHVKTWLRLEECGKLPQFPRNTTEILCGKDVCVAP